MLTNIFLLFNQGAETLAQAAGEMALTEEAGEITVSVWELTQKGGWIMAILGIMSLLAVYIFIERYLMIKRASKEDKNFMNNIRDYMHNGRLEAAMDLCKNTNTPIARMIQKGLSRLGKPLTDINAAIENVGNLEVARLEKNVGTLATVASVSPMIGFLGTVIGMVKAFYDMSMAGNNIDIGLLSSGIYQAMVTTIGGLIVGIIGYILYNILVARIEKMVFILEARATEFMDVLYEPAS
ncbi:MAG: MotA/TolQ/ExbB proton channel family protein [Bacteroidia bacterium]|jgi:biopolymer transport protein ExbB|nr:MotA/TolQ/ExbB proton channel family protein [Bacteroidales bacterium]MDD3961186.1 MotA/TolQ/ExbB proton channel family protein [Bacteroidales bacterium]MDY0284610.1 MotA/TolQ/ExbB proton channel family protein [Bacteroidales bacterium]NCD42049.1 MotA/TolQ/ExbB proton channel family protein [Bacteroidia bacterium]HPE85763.1 MotA/TolQ/ExbB proton channel family protein [Bacteroidales bacterium]